jgi:hypothetical protein
MNPVRVGEGLSLPTVATPRAWSGWPTQIACCQEALVEAHWESNAARFLSTPKQIITSLRMHAPTACILGFPADTSEERRQPVRRLVPEVRATDAACGCSGRRARFDTESSVTYESLQLTGRAPSHCQG